MSGRIDLRAAYWVALSGLGWLVGGDPGRCPGLQLGRPVGAKPAVGLFASRWRMGGDFLVGWSKLNIKVERYWYG